MYVDLARELKAHLAARLTDSGVTATARGLGGGWAPPALGLTPLGRGRARLAIRLSSKDDAEVLLTGLGDSVLEEIDVRVIGAVHVLSSPTPGRLRRRTRPLHPGLSVGHPSGTAGTLGGFVRLDGRLALLSNNHVVADGDAAAVGDPVLQPGPADGGTSGDRVATLATAERFRPDRGNLVDAAVAVVAPGVDVTPAWLPGGPLGEEPVAVDDIEPDELVEKVGRTTGHTRGRVTAVEVDGVAVQYDDAVYTFDGQIEIEGLRGSFSAGGDSGSVIWRGSDRAPLGLLFAGSEVGGSNGGGVTFANPLGTVLDVLGLEWITS